MLFKTLLLIVLVIVLFLVGLVFLVVRWVMAFIARAKEVAMQADREKTNRHSRDYTGRRQQQYGHSRRSSSQQTTNTTGSRTYRSASGEEVIIDTRNPESANRRIYEDGEGEYVDFEEEK